MPDNEKVSLPVFNGRDFNVWKMRLESMLVAKGYDSALRIKREGQGAESQESYEKKSIQAKAIILQALDNNHAKQVLSCTSAMQMWDRLNTIHSQRSKVNKVMIQKEFFDLQMKPNERAQDFFARAENVGSLLQDAGVDVPESTLVAKIVSGLTNQYSSFMSSWMGISEDGQTLSNLLSRLMAEDQIHTQFRSKDSVALNASADQSSFRKNTGKGRFTRRRQIKGKPGSKTEGKKDFK